MNTERVRWARACALTLASISCVVGLTACRSTPGTSAGESRASASSVSTPQTTDEATTNPTSIPSTSAPTTIPSTPQTQPASVTYPTVNVTYPNPYSPSYSTVASLVNDATFVIVGEVEAEGDLPYYPINIQTSLGLNYPHNGTDISPAEVQAADLTVGDSYVFFIGYDQQHPYTCVVGGVRGVFAYDATTDTVTRLDQGTPSQIPDTQTLEQLQAEVTAAYESNSSNPIPVPGPPVCDSSATGL